jgi:hypothetical protein
VIYPGDQLIIFKSGFLVNRLYRKHGFEYCGPFGAYREKFIQRIHDPNLESYRLSFIELEPAATISLQGYTH